MKYLSSRFHLASGLTSLVVSVLLLAQFLGVLPDRDGAVIESRVSLAETLAVSSMAMLDDPDSVRLQQVLDFTLHRNPALRWVKIQQQDGTVLAQAHQPPRAETALSVWWHQHWPQSISQWWAARNTPSETVAGVSTETHLQLPLQWDGRLWGHIDLEFSPLHDPTDWRTWAGSPWVLMGTISSCAFVLFYLYLRRMLSHLDPSRVIPGRVRTAFDTLAEGLMVLDPQGRIVLANRAFGEVLGVEPDALIGRAAESLPWSLPQPEGAVSQTEVADSSDAAPSPGGEGPALGQDLFTQNRSYRKVLLYLTDVHGQRRTFMLNGSPVPGANGQAAGMLVSLDDVTSLQEKELQLRLARDEAEAANQAKSDFLANMSHEIRTPMNAILGFAELLRRGRHLPPAQVQRHLDTIVGSGRHLLALINDILDLSKVEAGRLEVERVPCAVHQIVHEVVGIMQLRAQEKGVWLKVEFPERLPATMDTDPARLRQIITNLIGNALKFTLQGGVTVRTTLQPSVAGPMLLAIDIVDTGIGIPVNKLESIFEPFVQAEASTTRQFGGTGLGLAISRKFARALGGDITASSLPGQGSTFHVRLAIAAVSGVKWLSPQTLAQDQAFEADSGVNKSWRFDQGRVLVVDDGAENRELVRLVLESAGLTVVEAHHGAMALEVVAAQAPDLVLMDVQMPVMDGYTATRLLRERGYRKPVLALTANAMKGFEHQIEQAGFTGFLTKPVDIDALLKELAGHLQGYQVETLQEQAQVPTTSTTSLLGAEPSGAKQGEAAMVEVAVVPTALPPLVSRLAGHARLARVVRTFGHTLPIKLKAMEDALAAQRYEELAQLAHWLKGAGGTVGFDAFFEPAREFEQLALKRQHEALVHGLRQLQALASRVVIPDEPVDAATAQASVTAPASLAGAA